MGTAEKPFDMIRIGDGMNGSQNKPRRLTRGLGHRFLALGAGIRNWPSRASSSSSHDEGEYDTRDASGRVGPDPRAINRRNGHDAEQLVTPAERVLELLAQNGGRMRQGEIVTETEWSDSTVSRKLGELESSGSVTRYRIGREKLVFLPSEEPDFFGSPLTGKNEEPRRVA